MHTHIDPEANEINKNPSTFSIDSLIYGTFWQNSILAAVCLVNRHSGHLSCLFTLSTEPFCGWLLFYQACLLRLKKLFEKVLTPVTFWKSSCHDPSCRPGLYLAPNNCYSPAGTYHTPWNRLQQAATAGITGLQFGVSCYTLSTIVCFCQLTWLTTAIFQQQSKVLSRFSTFFVTAF